MHGKKSLVSIFFILVAVLLFAPAFAPTMQKMDNQKARSADSGRHSLRAVAKSLPAGIPSSRVTYDKSRQVEAFIYGGGWISSNIKSRVPGATTKPSAPSMAEMDDGEMQTAVADHGFLMAAVEGGIPADRPITYVVKSAEGRQAPAKDAVSGNGREVSAAIKGLPEEILEKIAAGRTPTVWTLRDNDLEVVFWAPLYKHLEPIAKAHEQGLWVPIYRYKLHRRYYDVTMERYGWEIDDFTIEDLKNLWRRYYVTGVGLDGRAVIIDRIVVDDYKYRPGGCQPFRHSSEEPFTAINTGGRISWFWRQAYMVHFEKIHGPAITTIPEDGRMKMPTGELIPPEFW